MKENMNIALSTLFPEIESGFTRGYEVDEYGHIWSTRRANKHRLAVQNPGTPNTYISVNKPAGYRYGRAITDTRAIKRSDIWNRLRRINGNPAVAAEPTKNVSKGYVIGSVISDRLSFSSFPKIHKSLAEVRTETERLAKANPGKTFIYLEIVSSCTAGGVVWS